MSNLKEDFKAINILKKRKGSKSELSGLLSAKRCGACKALYQDGMVYTCSLDGFDCSFDKPIRPLRPCPKPLTLKELRKSQGT